MQPSEKAHNLNSLIDRSKKKKRQVPNQELMCDEAEVVTGLKLVVAF